jgi:hypothetical protein
MQKRILITVVVGLFAIGLPYNSLGQWDLSSGIVSLQMSNSKVIAQDAIPTGALNYKFEIRGDLRVSSTVRGPSFTDDNNTSYFLDPNSTSNLWSLTAVNTFKAPSFIDNDNNSFFVDPAGSSVLSKLAVNTTIGGSDFATFRVGGHIGLGSTSAVLFGTDNAPIAGLLGDGSNGLTLRGGSIEGYSGGTVVIQGGGCGDCGNGGHVAITGGSGGSGFTNGHVTLVPSVGDVAVGYSTATTPSAKLDVNGSVRATSYITVSDGNLKTNIKQISGGLDKILKLMGATYSFKEDNKTGLLLPKGTQLGFIAQEVEAVLPEAVFTDLNNVKGVDYNKVIPVLVEAIKELTTQVQTLKSDLMDGMVAMNGSSDERFKSVELHQNNPNPFDRNTTISYKLVEGISSASIFVFDMQGKEVKRVTVPVDSKSIEIQGGELGAGLYIYSLIIDGKEIDTKRMILTR